MVASVPYVVDGAGQADDGNVELARELLRAGEGPVPADDDEGVDPCLDHVLVGDLPALRGHEILAAGGLEDGAAALDGVGHRGGGEFQELLVDQALIASLDADDIDVVEAGGARDGADGVRKMRQIPYADSASGASSPHLSAT